MEDKNLFKIDKRWFFKLGNSCFDEELYNHNLDILAFIHKASQDYCLEYVLAGIFALAIDYGYCYRNFKDLDILIKYDEYIKWIDILLANEWKYVPHQEDVNLGILSEVLKKNLENPEKFIPEKAYLTCYTSYKANLYKITNCCATNVNQLSSKILHNPIEDIAVDKEFFKIKLKTERSSSSTSWYPFIYYSKSENVAPNGKHGIPDEYSNVIKLKYKKYDTDFIYWESDDLKLEILEGIFLYKISIWSSITLRFIKETSPLSIDLIIDSYDRFDHDKVKYKKASFGELPYSIPKLIWEKKLKYGRRKDLNDFKYYNNIIKNY